MFIGVPFRCIKLSGSLVIILFSQDSISSVAIKLLNIEHYTLLAIPFFLLAGAFMTTGGVARRLIDLLMPPLDISRGGLAIASRAPVCFAALSGKPGNRGGCPVPLPLPVWCVPVIRLNLAPELSVTPRDIRYF